jgi:hypothetical protein
MKRIDGRVSRHWILPVASIADSLDYKAIRGLLNKLEFL